MKARTISSLFIVVGAILLLGQPAAAQFTISGTVTDTSGAPVFGVDIFLYRENGNPIGIPPTATDSSGFYAILNLPADNYGVGFEPSKITGLLPQLITPIVVGGNTTVNVTLLRGNILTGFVTDSIGAPLFNIDLNVYVQPEDTQIVASGDNTDTTGFYRVVMADGTYRIRWRPVLGENLLPVDIDNIVIVNDTSIDVTMYPGLIVSGTITGPGMTPVVNCDLDVIETATGNILSTPGDKTDLSGSYSIKVPPGTYDIQVEPVITDKLVPVELLAVPITKDTIMNFMLSAGVSFSGTLTDSFAVAVSGADLDLRFTATGTKLFTPADNTDAAGHYEVILPPGMFDIYYKPPVATRLAPIVVDSVMMTSDFILNSSVPDGVLLSGIVRNLGFATVSGVDLDANDVLTGTDVFIFGDNTDASGIFSFVVVSGIYDIDVEPRKTRHLSASQVLGIPIVNDTSIQIFLDTGMVITGVVKDSSGSVVSNVDVSAIVSVSGDTAFTPGDKTNLFGQYEILVPPETYDISYLPDTLSPITDTVLLTNVPVVKDTNINVEFSSGLPDCCILNRGDVNSDGADANILDLTYLVDFIFRGGSPALCAKEADVNSDGTPQNILDLTFLVDRIFRGGSAPGPC